MEYNTEIQYRGSDDTFFIAFPKTHVTNTRFEQPTQVTLTGILNKNNITIHVTPTQPTNSNHQNETTRQLCYRGSNTNEIVLNLPVEIINTFSLQNTPVTCTITQEQITISITPPDTETPNHGKTTFSSHSKTAQYSSGHYVLRIPTEIVGTQNAIKHTNSSGDSSPNTYTGTEYKRSINTDNKTVALQLIIEQDTLCCHIYTDTNDAPFNSRTITINPKFAYRKAGEIALSIPRPVGSMFPLDRIPFEWAEQDGVVYGKSRISLSDI